MPTNIFTYGSLMFPQVWERVVRSRYRSAAATVGGHARFVIVGEVYPGMIARPGSSVHGVAYFDVDASDLAALDAFEGGDYRRTHVLAAAEDGTSAAVDTYLYRHPQRLSDQMWHPEEFKMQRFLETYCRDRLGE
jgi:gamma-glutamylcyclotransferase (GGCT)/AIG2-like uncharacterized protein YtfP